MVGSVNASRDHYQIAVDDLMAAGLRWGYHLNRLITDHYPHHEFMTALGRHDENESKVVPERGTRPPGKGSAAKKGVPVRTTGWS